MHLAELGCWPSHVTTEGEMGKTRVKERNAEQKQKRAQETNKHIRKANEIKQIVNANRIRSTHLLVLVAMAPASIPSSRET